MDHQRQFRHLRRVAIMTCLLVVAWVVSPASARQDTTPTVTPLPEDSLLFSSNFASGDFSGWTFTDTQAEVVDDEGQPVLSLSGIELDGSSAIIQGGRAWTDYAIETRIKIVEVDTFNQLADLALIARSDMQSSDFVAVFISATNDRAIIGSVVDNQIVNTFGASFPFEPDVWYALRVTVQGKHVQLLIDGHEIAATDVVGQAAGGSAGLLTFLGTRVLIDSVQVFDLTRASVESTTVPAALDMPPTNTPSAIDASRTATETPAPATPTETPTPTYPLRLTPSLTFTPTYITPTQTAAPTSTGTLSPIGVRAAVIVAYANLRSGPGEAYLVYGQAQQGDTFTVVARADVNFERWYLVEAANGRTAWIWSELVQLSPDDVPIPEATWIPPVPAAAPSDG